MEVATSSGALQTLNSLIGTAKPSTSSKSQSAGNEGKGVIRYPTRLPELDPKLKEFVRLNLVYEKQLHFIRHWGKDLKARTNDKPTKKDYYNYALTVVETYPDLKGGKDGCVCIFDFIVHKLVH